MISSYSSNRPSAKELTQHGIITSLSPQQQPRPFPSLLYKSFFYGLNTADKFSRVFSWISMFSNIPKYDIKIRKGFYVERIKISHVRNKKTVSGLKCKHYYWTDHPKAVALSWKSVNCKVVQQDTCVSTVTWTFKSDNGRPGWITFALPKLIQKK